MCILMKYLIAKLQTRIWGFDMIMKLFEEANCNQTLCLQGYSQRGGAPSFPCLNSLDVIIGIQLGFWCGHAFDIATLLSLSLCWWLFTSSLNLLSKNPNDWFFMWPLFCDLIGYIELEGNK